MAPPRANGPPGFTGARPPPRGPGAEAPGSRCSSGSRRANTRSPRSSARPLPRPRRPTVGPAGRALARPGATPRPPREGRGPPGQRKTGRRPPSARHPFVDGALLALEDQPQTLQVFRLSEDQDVLRPLTVRTGHLEVGRRQTELPVQEAQGNHEQIHLL